MHVGGSDDDDDDDVVKENQVVVSGRMLNMVSEFNYCGGVVCNEGRMHVEISRRIALATLAFGKIVKVMKRKDVHVGVKRRMTCVMSVLFVRIRNMEHWILLS